MATQGNPLGRAGDRISTGLGRWRLQHTGEARVRAHAQHVDFGQRRLASTSSPASNTVRPGRVGGGMRSFLVQDWFDRFDLGGGAGRSSRASHATSARPTGEFCKRLMIDSLLTCLTSMNEWDHLRLRAWARQARVIVKHRAFEAWLARRPLPGPPAHRDFAPLRPLVPIHFMSYDKATTLSSRPTFVGAR